MSRDLDRPVRPDRADHARHRGRRPGAVADHAGRSVSTPSSAVGEVVGVALAPDLAVGDDVDAGALHVADGERWWRRPAPARRNGGGTRQRSAVAPGARPWRAAAVDQPVGLRIAAHDRRRQHRGRHRVPQRSLSLIIAPTSTASEDGSPAISTIGSSRSSNSRRRARLMMACISYIAGDVGQLEDLRRRTGAREAGRTAHRGPARRRRPWRRCRRARPAHGRRSGAMSTTPGWRRSCPRSCRRVRHDLQCWENTNWLPRSHPARV